MDPAIADWTNHARPHAIRAINDPQNAHWLQCEGTWFVGVDVLPNDAKGRIGASQELTGTAVDFIARLYGDMPPLHRAQVSVTWPGYPRPRMGETEAGFRYRKNRFAAHVDGLLPIGSKRQRKLREPHAFILGLALNDADPKASPLMLWEGSHHILRKAFEARLADLDPEQWSEMDLTETYQSARREIFDTCPCRPSPLKPGQAILLHRHLLHGIAPWDAPGEVQNTGRMIAYFRPQFSKNSPDWLTAP